MELGDQPGIVHSACLHVIDWDPLFKEDQVLCMANGTMDIFSNKTSSEIVYKKYFFKSTLDFGYKILKFDYFCILFFQMFLDCIALCPVFIQISRLVRDSWVDVQLERSGMYSSGAQSVWYEDTSYF